MRGLCNYLSLIILMYGSSYTTLLAQCTGGTSAGTITPTTTWQTTCVQGGRYISFSALVGRTYTFSFCQGGGSAPFWDTQITVMDDFGTLTTEGYNDDYCGTSSHLVFMAPSTGTFRIHITKYSCLSDATCQTMAYRVSAPLNDNICNAEYLYSNSCACSYLTFRNDYATSSPQANPGCAAYNGRDVWFVTKAPSSGELLISSQAGTMTDGGMAVYRGNACSSTLTLLGCDDDSGPGQMPELNLSGLTPGDSLYIRFWSYNNLQAGSFVLCLRDPAPYYCMAGQASEVNNSSACVNVTPNKIGQIGCVWNTTQIDMSSSFDYTFNANLGINNGNGADGMAFVLQNSPQGLTACGNPGNQLGIGPISNTLIVEFDTYNNGAVAADIANDHIAISVNGDLGNPVAGPVQASVSSINIEDGIDHAVRITWSPATMLFRVYFDGTLRLSYTNDIISTVFSGNPMVYWGVTASTGFYTNTQTICPGTLPGSPLPVTMGTFDAYLINQKAMLIWNTFSEKGSKEFDVERSSDGIHFTPIGIVPSKGTTSTNTRYEFVDPFPLPGISYYRLKQLDLNGDHTYSLIKSIQNTATSGNSQYRLYPNPASSDADITLELYEDAIVELYDNSSNMVHEQACTEGLNTLPLKSTNIANGMYHLVIRTSSATYRNRLILAN